MKRKTQIRLALLLVLGVAAVGDVVLRELPTQILARLEHNAARATFKPTAAVVLLAGPLSR